MWFLLAAHSDGSGSPRKDPTHPARFMPPTDDRPVEPCTLVSLDGGLVEIDSASCSFLRDATEHVDKGVYPVPFSVKALNVISAFTNSVRQTQVRLCPRRMLAHRTQTQSFRVFLPMQVNTGRPMTAVAANDTCRRAAAQTFEHKLESMSFELLFEVLRASSFLDCDGLLSMACRVTSRLMGTLRSTPSVLGAIVGLVPAAELTEAIDEPILTPPSSQPVDSEDHMLHDEDVLSLCLLECDVATLRVLKSLSPGWCHHARVTLCDPGWQAKQTVLDLDWALGMKNPSLENKLWRCCSSLFAALPNLTELTLLGVRVDLVALKGITCCTTAQGYMMTRSFHVDVRTLRLATWHMPASEQGYAPCVADMASGEAPPYLANRVHNLMAKGRVALHISSAMWLLANTSLVSVDLSGLVSQMCYDSWPSSIVRAFAVIVRSGTPQLRSFIFNKFDIPVKRLRTPGLEPEDIFTLNFEGSALCAPDLLFMCNAGGELSHVHELLLSSNHIGDNGLITLLEEIRPPVMLLANVRWVTLNDCLIGDPGLECFARAVSNGAFAHLEQICLAFNRFGDAGLSALMDAAVEYGALSKLAHLNVGSNEITDLGCSHFAQALRRGALPKLVHLSFGLNQLGDDGIVALAEATGDKGCRARLHYLGLGGNRIGNVGARALAEAMRCSTGLSCLWGLWIADNERITDPGAAALASGFQINGMLREIYVQGLGISRDGQDILIAAVPFLPLLTRFVLGRASPHALTRLEELQHQLRDRHEREDIILCGWPQASSMPEKPPRPRWPRARTWRPPAVASSLRYTSTGP